MWYGAVLALLTGFTFGPAGVRAQSAPGGGADGTAAGPAPATAAGAAPGTAAGTGPAPAADDTLFPPDRWKFGLDFSLTSASGNEDITVLTSGFKMTHLLKSQYELELGANYRYGMSQGEVVARNAKGEAKFDFQPEAPFSPFVFATAERDPFRKLDLRAHGGAGAKYSLVETDDAEASLSLAGLYSYEDHRLDGPSPGVPKFQREARLSWRFVGRKQWGGGMSVNNTTYYQPVWDVAGDYLFSTDTTARMVLKKWIAVTFGYTFERDSTPLPDVNPNDQLIRGGISLQW